MLFHVSERSGITEFVPRPSRPQWGGAATVARVRQFRAKIGLPPMKVNIERAHARDADHVLRLVKENQLTTDGLLNHLATILVARLEHRVVGTAALEMYSDGALLRSVAVSSEVRGQGLGAMLVESALHIAEQLSVRDVYLLTFTAGSYFERFGFQSLDRGDVPASVRTSVQFTHACPSTASVMRKRLKLADQTRSLNTIL